MICSLRGTFSICRATYVHTSDLGSFAVTRLQPLATGTGTDNRAGVYDTGGQETECHLRAMANKGSKRLGGSDLGMFVTRLG